MARPIVTVPAPLMRALQVAWDPDWRGQTSGAFLSGVSRPVNNAFPRWVGQAPLRLSRDMILQWRAIEAQAEGRRGIYRVPMIDPLGFDPGETDTNGYAQTGVPFSNGQTLANGLGLAFEPFVTAGAAADAGAVSLRVDTRPSGGFVPRVGQYLSHDDWPMIVTARRQHATDFWDLDVQMPLRAAISFGDPIMLRAHGRFERPEETPGGLSYGRNQRAEPTLVLQEVLTR